MDRRHSGGPTHLYDRAGGEDAVTDAVPPNWPPEFVEFVKECTESIEDEVPKGSAAIAMFSDFDDREPELVLE